MIPHPDKAYKGGEDAFFNSTNMLVIADGVGGWNEFGIDPSKYSRFLAKQYLEENFTKYVNSPLEVMTRAHKENTNLGSSTMLVISVDQSLLKYCYIGDSGFILLRKENEYQNMTIIYQYQEQQHSFNFPYQLDKSEISDHPKSSICGNIEVTEGDIIVAGSDGLFDNLYVTQIKEYIEQAERMGTQFSVTAAKLAIEAIEVGKSKEIYSPFASKAHANRLFYIGGKLDDTTVIVAKIKPSIDLINLD